MADDLSQQEPQRQQANEAAPGESRSLGPARRIVWLAAAGVFFVIGALGAILPVLPATPFLLLSSFFLVRSSPKLNSMLLRSRWFGPILTDWQVNGGIRRNVKFKAIGFVVVAVAASCYFSRNSPWAVGTIIGLALIGVLVILKLPVARPRSLAPLDAKPLDSKPLDSKPLDGATHDDRV